MEMKNIHIADMKSKLEASGDNYKAQFCVLYMPKGKVEGNELELVKMKMVSYQKNGKFQMKKVLGVMGKLSEHDE